MASKPKVYFFFDNISMGLKNRIRLKKEIEGIFLREKKKLIRLNYVFCSDKTLLKINRNYLKHNEYTDIITFDLSSRSGEVEGEIYISWERVKSNAIQLGQLKSIELRRVIFHGALHLCGYK